LGQAVKALRVRIAPPWASFTTPLPPGDPAVDQARQTPVAPLAPDSATGKTETSAATAGAEVAHKAEPARVESIRVPAPPPELPARGRPPLISEEGAQSRRPARSAVSTESSIKEARPAAVLPAPSPPRVELILSPPPTSTDGSYMVRISDGRGRTIEGAEASLVGLSSDGSALSVPLGPGPEPGTYHATIPHGGPLRAIRVRIVTNDNRFDVPVER
jgi:hypothetical protein